MLRLLPFSSPVQVTGFILDRIKSGDISDLPKGLGGDDRSDLLVGVRLAEVVRRPVAHRVDCVLDRTKRSEQDDRRLGLVLPQFL